MKNRLAQDGKSFGAEWEIVWSFGSFSYFSRRLRNFRFSFNANTRKLAEQIKARRILDIQSHGLVDWEGVKRSRMTLSEWVDKYATEEFGISPDGMRSKRNAQARVEEYLVHIGKPDVALRGVDKDFCKASHRRLISIGTNDCATT